MPDVTVLVLEDAFPSGVAATLDVLAAARALAPRTGTWAPTWQVCSPNGGAVPLGDALVVRTERLGASGDGSVWVVPGLGTTTRHHVRHRLEQPDAVAAAQALGRHVAAGGRVAASCSSVFLLQRAGLLRDRRATTTWWLGGLLAELEPRCTVSTDKMVCADGPVVTGGAAFAQVDLVLHLLRDLAGSALADAVARTLVVDAREAQAPYVVPEVLADGDALVAELVRRIEDALPAAPTVAALARDLGVSERTLARRVHRTTGSSPIALLRSVRLRRARALLAATTASVEQVAAAVGYRDPTALRRALRAAGGSTPSRYRNT